MLLSEATAGCSQAINTLVANSQREVNLGGIKVDMKKDSLFEVPVGVSSFGNP